LTAAQIKEREPAAFADWMSRVGEFPFPEGESVPDLLARVAPAFDKIVAAHGGATDRHRCPRWTQPRAALRALGLPLGRLLAFGQDYAALTVLEEASGGWALRRLNERPML
jgi:broad specificity phosphatase PhoE